MLHSAGLDFRNQLIVNKPLQIPGVINAYHALMAEHAGFKALYLSGGGVSAGSLGLPDLGISTLDDVLIDVRRITDASSLPLLVDIDTGFGGFFNIQRTIKSLVKFGAAACHIEDQIQAKRCGHRPNKALVSSSEMCDRIKAAVDARQDEHFVIMARTDAIANESLESAIDRMNAYIEAGADMIFAEAATGLTMYRQIKENISVPLLANMTEFGVTPLASCGELAEFGIDMVLYPLSGFRAMNQAALQVFTALKQDGSQKNVINLMQTRQELYNHLNYYSYENKLNAIIDQE